MIKHYVPPTNINKINLHEKFNQTEVEKVMQVNNYYSYE